MMTTRVIPCLLLKGQGLVKTIRFKKPQYVGDPINAVRIFNDKEVDELVILDISATMEGRRPDFKLIEDIASEAFMPFGYGGGIRSLDDVRTLFKLGVEKVIINSYAAENPSFIGEVANVVGGQSVVVSIDVKKNIFGKYEMFSKSGQKKAALDIEAFVSRMQDMGAGELLLTSIDRDGGMMGYDTTLINKIAKILDIPVIACGGAGKTEDFALAVQAGASAVAAGSMFVFHGRHRAVLISYPDQKIMKRVFAA